MYCIAESNVLVFGGLTVGRKAKVHCKKVQQGARRCKKVQEGAKNTKSTHIIKCLLLKIFSLAREKSISGFY